MALPKLYDRIIFHNDTEPALNEDNLNAMSKGLDDVDDRLIDLAGTIMEDVPQIIEDMEILGPAIENIDSNVTRAETAADNAEAEALKSEGYAVGTQDGVEVTSGEYYQNNAKYYAEIANPPIENTVDFTDIITVTDAINKAAKDVRLKVEAVQDLHGYNNPWVGGAGKNLMPLDMATIKANNTSGTWNGNIYTLYGVAFTFVVDTAGNLIAVKTVGTATGDAPFVNLTNNRVPASGLIGKLVTGCSGGSSSTYDLRVVYRNSNYGWITSDAQYNAAITIRDNVSGTEYIQMGINIANGATVNTTFYPMISTSGGTFEPYTNICPISGWDNAKVTRSGKNLLDMPSSVVVPSGTNWLNAKAITLKAGTYTFSCKSTATSGASSFEVYDASNNLLYSGDFAWSAEVTKTFTISGTAAYMYAWTATATTLTELQIESGNQKTAYEPYKETEELTISLNGTRYGGTLDVTSGVLTLDRGFAEFDGSEDESISLYNSRNGFQFGGLTGMSSASFVEGLCNQATIVTSVTQHGMRYTDTVAYWLYAQDDLGITTVEGLRTYLASHPLQMLYMLATPQTIQLTPTQVYLLYGYNTLFGDCGDISLTYDASGIIHIEEAKLDTETLKTIAAASSDFADFKARIAAL